MIRQDYWSLKRQVHHEQNFFFVESMLSATIKTALEAAGVALPVITFWGAKQRAR